MEDLKIRNL
ncbi:hypothetical protein ABFA07_000884 [Porites harrisoni]